MTAAISLSVISFAYLDVVPRIWFGDGRRKLYAVFFSTIAGTDLLIYEKDL